MNSKQKIGLLGALAVVGTGYFLFKNDRDEKPTSNTDKETKLHGDDTESNFIGISNARVHQALMAQNPNYAKAYKKDLKTWGTVSGVMDVSNDFDEAKRKKKKLKAFAKKALEVQKNYKEKAAHLPEISKTQITLTNNGTSVRAINLWGANMGTSISKPLPGDVQDHKVNQEVQTGIHPQNVGFNSFNGLLYVANQLSDSITIMDTSGAIVKTVALGNVYPGFVSPVDIAFNPSNGEAWVVCSVENTIKILDATHSIIQTIPVGNRPTSIAYNPENSCFYVSNLLDNTLSKIESSTYNLVATLNTGEDPRTVSVWNQQGTVWVSNSSSDSVSVFDAADNLLNEINATGDYPTEFTTNTSSLFLIAKNSNELLELNPQTQNIENTYPLGFQPSGIIYNPVNGFLYVLSSQTGLTYIYSTTGTLSETLSLNNAPNIGIAVLPSGEVFTTNTNGGKLAFIGYTESSSDITINESYPEKRAEFQFKPALVKHAKFVFSDENRASGLKLIHQSPTGKQHVTPISFNNYKSPQNYLDVAEVTAVRGDVIDGKSTWEFKIAPGQTITILVYYKQLQFKYLIPTIKI